GTVAAATGADIQPGRVRLPPNPDLSIRQSPCLWSGFGGSLTLPSDRSFASWRGFTGVCATLALETQDERPGDFASFGHALFRTKFFQPVTLHFCQRSGVVAGPTCGSVDLGHETGRFFVVDRPEGQQETLLARLDKAASQT